MPRLSVIVLTFNEEKNIEACLDSLKALASVPVFVVDSYSTDQTMALLNSRAVTVAQRAFENYAQQRNWAQANVPFDTEWVLHLDAGERLTLEMANWINNSFDSDSKANGFMFSRRTYFMNRWIRYGGHYPNFHLRLFRRAKGHCEAKAYDQHFVCEGKVEKVPAGIDLMDQVANNLREFTASHTRWALAEAQERAMNSGSEGEVLARLNGTAIERRRWLKTRLFDRSPLFMRAFFYFFYRYFIRLGFLDGRPGLIFHFLQACWFRFLVDAMYYEMQSQQQKP
ncbi:MAG: glycosyltransferase family 2 protein [Lewinellaceae bacterium]|nr:glycosyltransferase family 2 protein [Lewinellaceae bacterium]